MIKENKDPPPHFLTFHLRPHSCLFERLILTGCGGAFRIERGIQISFARFLLTTSDVSVLVSVTEAAFEVGVKVSLLGVGGAADHVGLGGTHKLVHPAASETGFTLGLLAVSAFGIVGDEAVALVLEVFIDVVADLILILHELHTETTVNVPDDVAMHEPDSRVVGRETNDGPAVVDQQGGVTTSRVVEV